MAEKLLPKEVSNARGRPDGSAAAAEVAAAEPVEETSVVVVLAVAVALVDKWSLVIDSVEPELELVCVCTVEVLNGSTPPSCRRTTRPCSLSSKVVRTSSFMGLIPVCRAFCPSTLASDVSISATKASNESRIVCTQEIVGFS